MPGGCEVSRWWWALAGRAGAAGDVAVAGGAVVRRGRGAGGGGGPAVGEHEVGLAGLHFSVSHLGPWGRRDAGKMFGGAATARPFTPDADPYAGGPVDQGQHVGGFRSP